MTELLQTPLVTGVRRLFILISPNETSFENIEDVPDYVDEAVPYFIALMLIEWLILYLRGKHVRLNDSLSSLSNGVLSLLHSLIFRSTEVAAFMWMYERFNIVTLPWDNPLTWLLTLLGVDLAYYWVHRFGHEMNIMWAGHQTHHSSEEYNLSTALRQSAIQKYYSWMFYMPLALFLPPSLFLVHTQFNLIYQFWIHTETLGKLGPLEWFLSTPSHHRVHHGRNPYCIDKNYGGIFIIWDRMFGTFEAEREDEKVVYGLVHNIDTWQPIYAQLHHLWYILQTMWSMEGWGNKLSVMFKGPGWSPGKPRLGLPEDIPQVEGNPVKYDVSISWFKTLYVWAHFLVILICWQPALAHMKQEVSVGYMAVNVAFVVLSLFIYGAIYDRRWYGMVLEMLRCAGLTLLWRLGVHLPISEPVCWFFAVSLFLCTISMLQGTSQGTSGNKKLK